jgi:hypothetical protein
MTVPISPDDWEILSAYLDGQVSARENEQIRLRLEAQPELQRALEELRRTRTVLRSVPRKRVPRNFTLTRAMVPQRKPWFRLVPSLGFASGLATLLLVLSFAFEFLPGLNNSFQPSVAQAPAPAVSSGQLAKPLQAPRASDTNPSTANQGAPIVIWNFGATGLGGGGGGAPEIAPPAAGSLVATPEGGIGGGPTSAPSKGTEPLPTQPAQIEVTPTLPPKIGPSVASNPTETTPIQKSPPEATAAPAPTEIVPPTVMATPAPTEPPPLTGTGPILGIRPTQEMGKIVVDQGADQALRELATPPAARTPAAAPSFFARNLVPIQIGLVVLALVAGLAAFFLGRKF